MSTTSSTAGGSCSERRDHRSGTEGVEFFDEGPSHVGPVLTVHSLRIVPAKLSDVPRAGTGSGFAARAQLPDPASGRGQPGDRGFVRHAHGPLSRLACVRNGVSVGRALWGHPGASALSDRNSLQPGMDVAADPRLFLSPNTEPVAAAGTTGTAPALLPEIRIASIRARKRTTESVRTGKTRGAVARG